MLKTIEIFEKMSLEDKEKYRDMLSMINIPDFYKCMAQFSGLTIREIDNDVIIKCLEKWCKNKYRFYKMLGNKIKIDFDFSYVRPKSDISNSFNDLSKEFPAYALWLKEFSHLEKNKIDGYKLGYNVKSIMHELFPDFHYEGSSLTHFFKMKLKAEDTLVTKIGRIFENDHIQAKYTMSIDPVDMMFASENPYNWTSCYRLELDREDSHADGCMAAILDSTSIITYVWEREGEFNMYDNFKFKKVRYYRMRQWLAIALDWSAIHFNSIYPGKHDYSDELEKQFRAIPEKLVAEAAGVDNLWRKNDELLVKRPWGDSHSYRYNCERKYYYGYGEFGFSNIWINSALCPMGSKQVLDEKEFNQLYIIAYDEKIPCLCGCGCELDGSDECVDSGEEGLSYNGEGFVAENFYENEIEYKWCPYRDCECTCSCYYDEECDCDCEIYRDEHPECSLALGYNCEDPDSEYIEDGVMQACSEYCEDCWRWKSEQAAAADND